MVEYRNIPVMNALQKEWKYLIRWLRIQSSIYLFPLESHFLDESTFFMCQLSSYSHTYLKSACSNQLYFFIKMRNLIIRMLQENACNEKWQGACNSFLQNKVLYMGDFLHFPVTKHFSLFYNSIENLPKVIILWEAIKIGNIDCCT